MNNRACSYRIHTIRAYVFDFLLYNKKGVAANIYRIISLILFDKPVNIY